LVGHLLFFTGHLRILLLRLTRLRTTGKHLAQTVLKIGLVLRKLVGLLCHIVELLRSVLALYPIQDVMRFLQALARPLLSGIGLIGIAALLIFGLAHIVGGARQAIQCLLKPWIGGGPGALGTGRLLALLLPLLSLLRGLAGLSLLTGSRLLLGRIAPGELLHLPLELLRFPAKHFLLPTLPERLLLILLSCQLLLAASQFGEFLKRRVDFFGAGVRSRLLAGFVLIFFAVQLQVGEVLQIPGLAASLPGAASASERHLDIAECVLGSQGVL
jgi:hypothetical protein